jgi:hypothetical protein
LAIMTSNRTVLVIIGVALGAVALIAPLAIRAGLRYSALERVLRRPEARQRLAVQPSSRTLTTLPHVQTINLGYATFDTGSTNPISIEGTSNGAAVLLTNRDVSMAFLPPYGLEDPRNRSSAKVSPGEARAHPHTLAYMQQLEGDQVTAEMAMEETRILPFSKLLRMSNDDFLAYSMRIALKAGNSAGLKEVQFFNAPDAKGIVRIGKNTNDNRFAAVFLASPDGARKVNLLLRVCGSSSSDIWASLDPILRSFRFTADTVDSRDRVKALIRAAGIRQREDSQLGGAANRSQPVHPSTNQTSAAAGSGR